MVIFNPCQSINYMEESMELDCRGLQCPEPVTRCRALLKSRQPDSLLVIVDNSAAPGKCQQIFESQRLSGNIQQGC